MPASQKKKLRQKQRKAEARAKKEAEVKNEEANVGVSKYGKRNVKTVDPDPNGEKLLQMLGMCHIFILHHKILYFIQQKDENNKALSSKKIPEASTDGGVAKDQNAPNVTKVKTQKMTTKIKNHLVNRTQAQNQNHLADSSTRTPSRNPSSSGESDSSIDSRRYEVKKNEGGGNNNMNSQ
ncbi:unnamed protein product [Lactuca virosa]|uniref:Small EDRK-rich factor-like N-terminal domain-containing protein n=1 Tax=Lactuca virosa TaxID=75947 RepID=A0AAU9NA91_9ASTR|nr:unnamed protein product [Lactuca virosa]